MAKAVGIDQGTTSSVIAAHEGGQPTAENSLLRPAVVTVAGGRE